MQQLNCAIGDLAIVTSAVLPENLGQIVEILGPQTGKPFALVGAEHFWEVRTVSGRPTLVYRFRGAHTRIRRSVVGPVPDCRLRPISGLELNEPADALALNT